MNIKNLQKRLNLGNNAILFIIVLIGVILMLFSGSTPAKKTKSDTNITQEFSVDDEEKLKKILSDIKGAGKVSVMVTYESGTQSDIAYDTDTKINQKGDEKSVLNTEESTEKKVVISSGEPIILKNIYPKVKGVVVAAQGAGSPRVRQDIQNAVVCAMGIAPHRVCIVEKSM